MGSHVERAECYADMAMGDGTHRKQGSRRRCQPMERGRCGKAWGIATGQRLDVLRGVTAARSSNYIGHELGASGREHFATKDGTSSGGNVP